MPKRRLEDADLALDSEEAEGPRKVRIAPKHVKKHTLDSDEEDSGEDIPDQEEHLEGQEEATISREGGVAITPFNMREELEEGHFDGQGYYHWKKETEIKDSWLDNIDWVKVHNRPEDKSKIDKDDDLKGLGDKSSSESEDESNFNLIASYKEMLSFMKEKETVLNALRRLGPRKKISSVERWKLKKAGIEDSSAESVTKLTSIANEVLSKTGNMDVYQMTFEKIQSIINKADKSDKKDELDMYADDFDTKEKEKKKETGGIEEAKEEKNDEIDEEPELMWEFKWKQGDDVEVHGPHTTNQMQQWVTEGYFKTGVFVRKCGQEGPFYTSNRIDFELYL